MSTEEKMDRLSAPLRSALDTWARHRGLEWSGGYSKGDKAWIYYMVLDSKRVSVAVKENGSDAIVMCLDTKGKPHLGTATTPRGLMSILTKYLGDA